MSTANTPYKALSKFSISVFTINGLLMQSGEIVTRPFGQSSARWQVLGRAGHQPQTVAQMARSIGNSRQSVQRLADILTREGLTVYQDNPADKRAHLLAATLKGMQVLKNISARDEEWSAGLMEQLDAEQLAVLADKLDDISKTLASYMNPKEEQ